jgi:monofunctional biosynthetic peptidoglycan transglycosylase
VEAAARTYFHAPALSLGASEAAALAACIVNPRAMNPSRPTARFRRRQQMILKRMGAVIPPVENVVDRR